MAIANLPAISAFFSDTVWQSIYSDDSLASPFQDFRVSRENAARGSTTKQLQNRNSFGPI